MAGKDSFSSRWGMLLAVFGMAVGTGNIWRFPRIVAKNGGGAFLIPWLIFLFLWSVPLLITELSIGKKTRLGPYGSFAKLLGPRLGWMGGFVAFCTLAIMFYYAVVTGWTYKYVVASAVGALNSVSASQYWSHFSSSVAQPILFHAIAFLVSGAIVYRGVSGGIEKASRVLMPTLIVLLVVGAIRAVTLPGAVAGLNFLFHPEWRSLADHRVWLEALSQSAWSTGAGWGLVLTYAVYARENEDSVLNGFLTGFGDNSASLLAGLMIFPAVFALAPGLGLVPEKIVAETGPANTGMAFIWIPELFRQIPAGRVFLTAFFLALAIAATTSLMSMIELGVRILMDAGWVRRSAVVTLVMIGFLLGLPSAVDMGFFENQDWVWGLGLIVSGLFFAVIVIRYGPSRFRRDFVNVAGNDLPVGRWFDWTMAYVIPLLFVAMLGWWFYQSATSYDPSGWWNPFHRFSLGTCIVQWVVVVALLVVFNRRIVARTLSREEAS
ncbi:MAG TPA: sodium-dependent transporter [Bacteroidetes bacterium]|nr:sodium-dependent transporter [Bacteroidota bacterium]